MTLAYFDCFSGISGDMTLGALIHLGVPVAWLKDQLGRLPLTNFDIQTENVTPNGIQAVHVKVTAEQDQPHRHFTHIADAIEASPYSDHVKNNAMGIFDRIAEAEAKIHGCAKEAVHFHEVGAVDAMVDIIGTCLALEYLGIDRIRVSELPVGSGFVTCQHGVLPVPAPATVEILKNIPIYSGTQKQELVTPTGAAIVAALAEGFGAMPAMQVEGVGYGAGTHKLEGQPNLLRVLMGRPADQAVEAVQETLMVVETAIDDMNPEIFGYLMERLFEDGALDALMIPVHMKKNRPGTLIQVICHPELRGTIIHRILDETTSLGVRYYEVGRTALRRRPVTLQTPYGPLAAKKVEGPAGRTRVVPEYEACRKTALEKGLPLKDIYQAAIMASSSSESSS